MKNFILKFLAIVLFLSFLSVFSFLLLGIYGFQVSSVQDKSMYPNFLEKDVCIIEKIQMVMQIKRGDVVVLHNPNAPSKLLIKRVIALPGESVKIQDNKIFIKPTGAKEKWSTLKENYLSFSWPMKDLEETKMPIDGYYILGDNRTISLDSSTFGSITKDRIVGKVVLKINPFFIYDPLRYL